jgi:glycine dehydrogenase subunit 1
MDFTQITDNQVETMLQTCGVRSMEELFAPIPTAQRLTRELRIPAGCSEPEILAELHDLAGRNLTTREAACFLGCGAYDHFVPAVVDHLAMRGEFLTAYTPYQAEASQGTLQVFYEFQTMICQITGMDIANASLYENASSVAEAMLMARAVTGRSRVVVSATCHPDTIETVTTYASQQGIEVSIVPHRDGVTSLSQLQAAIDDSTMAVVVQLPNFFGCLEDVESRIKAAHDRGALAIVSFDPIAGGLLKRPGELGADIVVGEGQSLGIPLQYGGPYLGFFACRKEYLRKMPGRVVGAAQDMNGKRGFCLALQTREQHIKRERATSNICTNQGLMAVRAAVYLAAMGKNGIYQVASLCLDKSHYAARQIAELPGYALKYSAPFFKEFVVQTEHQVGRVLDQCSQRGILAGVPLGQWFQDMKDCFSVAVTEKRTRQEIDALVQALRDV